MLAEDRQHETLSHEFLIHLIILFLKKYCSTFSCLKLYKYFTGYKHL